MRPRQGFLFAQPLTPDAVEVFLDEGAADAARSVGLRTDRLTGRARHRRADEAASTIEAFAARARCALSRLVASGTQHRRARRTAYEPAATS